MCCKSATFNFLSFLNFRSNCCRYRTNAMNKYPPQHCAGPSQSDQPHRTRCIASPAPGRLQHERGLLASFAIPPPIIRRRRRVASSAIYSIRALSLAEGGEFADGYAQCEPSRFVCVCVLLRIFYVHHTAAPPRKHHPTLPSGLYQTPNTRYTIHTLFVLSFVGGTMVTDAGGGEGVVTPIESLRLLCAHMCGVCTVCFLGKAY